MPHAEPMRDDVRRPFYARASFIIAAVVVVLAAIGGGVWFSMGARDRAYREGADAYARGAREVARVAFARAATDEPDDPRPLVYLGRMAREENDFPRAQRYLDRALRLAPGSALAQREMGATMLAKGEPELARRFYVRAIELDPNDRLSQGFLACAMHRLGRTADAATWANRAGPGDWSACLAAPPGVIPPVVPSGVTNGAAGTAPAPR